MESRVDENLERMINGDCLLMQYLHNKGIAIRVPVQRYNSMVNQMNDMFEFPTTSRLKQTQM